MLKMLGQQEVNETLAEQGRIEVKCEFCNTAYDFDPVDARQLFVGDGTLSEPGHTRH
jgi:molecular chaperone Hsp33